MRAAVVWLLTSSVFVTSLAHGQTRPVPRITLRPATATHPYAFTRLGSVRELSDGRLLAGDPAEGKIAVLDFAKKSVTHFGRTGKGPGEYSGVERFLAVGADSTLMIDSGSRRWLLFHSDRIVATVPPDAPAIVATQSLINGADTLGKVSIVREPRRTKAVTITGATDSSVVILVDRVTGKSDTVGRVRNAEMVLHQVSRADGSISSSKRAFAVAMPSHEQALLFTDGWLAVARLDPFRVDWRSPSGEWTRGAALPVPRIAVTAREIDFHKERSAELASMQSMPDEIRAMLPEPRTTYPAQLPVFRMSDALHQGPEGLLLVRRRTSVDHQRASYFVIDRRGALVGELTLGANQEIVGAGARSVYVAVEDDDGFKRIRRHPWN